SGGSRLTIDLPARARPPTPVNRQRGSPRRRIGSRPQSPARSTPMGRIGYVVASDRVRPREAVDLAGLAEAAGFDGTLATDLFQPWLPTLGEAPRVLPLLGALAERTTTDFGAGMAVPGYRAHPASIAQASATLAALHPGRHFLTVSAGEALSEH